MTLTMVHRAKRMSTRGAHRGSEGLHTVFVAALLLTGRADRAEWSVLEGISTVDGGNTSTRNILEATLRVAVNQTMTMGEETSEERKAAASWLPMELQRVLVLPMDLRRAFVLRSLLGLPRFQCSRLLDLDEVELDELTVSAALALTKIKAQETKDA